MKYSWQAKRQSRAKHETLNIIHPLGSAAWLVQEPLTIKQYDKSKLDQGGAGP
jgi:hypothetical protein